MDGNTISIIFAAGLALGVVLTSGAHWLFDRPNVSRITWRKWPSIATPGEADEHAWIRVLDGAHEYWIRLTRAQLDEAQVRARTNREDRP